MHDITTMIVVLIIIIIIIMLFVIVIYPVTNYLLTRSTQTSASIAFDEPSQLSLQSCMRGFFDRLLAASHVAHLNKRHYE